VRAKRVHQEGNHAIIGPRADRGQMSSSSRNGQAQAKSCRLGFVQHGLPSRPPDVWSPGWAVCPTYAWRNRAGLPFENATTCPTAAPERKRVHPIGPLPRDLVPRASHCVLGRIRGIVGADPARYPGALSARSRSGLGGRRPCLAAPAVSWTSPKGVASASAAGPQFLAVPPNQPALTHPGAGYAK
jgi:hypothetical protein